MTNFVKVKYNEIVDVGTKNGALTVLGFGTPRGKKPYTMLKGLFDQYRYFKYKGQKITVQALQPRAVDPLQVGFEPGQQIRPQAMANPTLFRGCHGDNMGVVLNQMFKDSGFDFQSSSVDVLNNAQFQSSILDWYYASLCDARYRKYHPQSSFRLSLYPLVHKMATLRPILPAFNESALATQYLDTGNFLPNQSEESKNTSVLQDVQFSLPDSRKVPTEKAGGEVPIPSEDAFLYSAVFGNDVLITQGQLDEIDLEHKHDIDPAKLNDALAKSFVDVGGSGGVGQGCGIQTPNGAVAIPNVSGLRLATNGVIGAGLQRLPWLPTRVLAPVNDVSDDTPTGAPQRTALPRVNMGILVLPPAFDDGFNFFYRLYIQHTFMFKGFTTNMNNSPLLVEETDYHDFIENDDPDNVSVDVVGGDAKLVNAGVQ